MSEPTKRDRAAESLGRLFRRAARCLEPEPGDAEALVGMIVDAAAERVRGEMRDDHIRLAPPLVPCYKCRSLCPCPGTWFTCPRCGLEQSKPEARKTENGDI